MKKYIVIAILAAGLIPAVHFLTSGNPDSGCFAIVMFFAGIGAFLCYELDLSAKETDMQLDEWELQNEEKSRILITKTAIQRELIRQWANL